MITFVLKMLEVVSDFRAYVKKNDDRFRNESNRVDSMYRDIERKYAETIGYGEFSGKHIREIVYGLIKEYDQTKGTRT